MEETYRTHRGVLSWPTPSALTKDKPLIPEDLDVDIIGHDAIEELSNMVDLAPRHDETLAIFDLGCVVDHFMLWKRCFPRIRPFYAIKVYDDPVVISVLSRLGAGFDCASKNEVDIVLRCGVDASSIIYANTIKFPSHLEFAANNNITLMTVDNEDELLKIKHIAPDSRLVVRMAPIPAANVQWSLGGKFGCSRQRALKLFKLAKQLELDVVGISFHVGSGCSDASIYITHIKVARVLFDDAHSEGFHLKVLDIGGGLFGHTGAEHILQKMCGPINDSLEELFPESCGIQVIAEPGRYFVEAALSVAACIVGKRVPDYGCSDIGPENGPSDMEPKHKPSYMGPRFGCSDTGPQHGPSSTGPEHQPDMDINVKADGTTNEDSIVFEYYLSESVYGLLNMILYGSCDYTMRPLKRESAKTQLYISKLWGPTCDSGDLVMERCSIPELDIGDWLVFYDVGAYTVTCGGTFNGMPQPRIHRVITQTLWDKLIDNIANN